MRRFPTRKDSATVDLKVRMKEPLRRALAKAASAHGVSLNAEAVARLQRSFHYDDVLKLLSSPDVPTTSKNT